MKLVKQEMEILKKFDNVGCSVGQILTCFASRLAFRVDEYVNSLDALLAKKLSRSAALQLLA